MFAVLSVESIPTHLRGYVSRFLQEIHTGLYVGVVTSRVVDDLWEQVTLMAKEGQVSLIASDGEKETGFSLRLHQPRRHRIADFDGIALPVKLA